MDNKKIRSLTTKSKTLSLTTTRTITTAVLAGTLVLGASMVLAFLPPVQYASAQQPGQPGQPGEGGGEPGQPGQPGQPGEAQSGEGGGEPSEAQTATVEPEPLDCVSIVGGDSQLEDAITTLEALGFDVDSLVLESCQAAG